MSRMGSATTAAASRSATTGPRRNRFGFFGQFIDAKGLHILLRAVTLLRTDGFTDFVVEINGDNIRFATDGCRQEIEAFLEAEARRPAEERIVSMNGSYQVDQLRQRMARIDWCGRAVDLVGGLRPGHFRGPDVQAAADRLEHRRPRRARAQ